MGRERNLDSIQAIEREIKEHEMAISKLKQARNSLLNISTLIPPEILGAIFYWTMIPQQEHSRSQKVPHNLLFVCHHWLEVALHTPCLWTSWGDSLQDWERHYTCPGTSELCLELTGGYSARGQSLSDLLRAALQDRAAQDVIRRVSLCDEDSELLNSVISAIIPRGKEIQSTSLESIEVHPECRSKSTVELSNLFSHYNFPRLRWLRISGRCNISSWGLLASRTSALVTLSLGVRDGPTLTTSQLLSILSSNPNLQHLELSHAVLPKFNSNEFSFQVQLHHVEQGACSVYSILHKATLDLT